MLAVGGAGGCGSDGDGGGAADTGSINADTAEYTVRMQTICDQLQNRLAAVRDNETLYAASVEKMLRARRRALVALENEVPPADFAQAHAGLVSAQTSAVALGDELVARLFPEGEGGWDGSPLGDDDIDTFTNLAATNRLARAAWGAVGVTGCG
jgi:hypothetical protein